MIRKALFALMGLLLCFGVANLQAQTSRPASWLPKIEFQNLPQFSKITEKKAQEMYTYLSNQPCFPIKKIIPSEHCVARAHAMWGLLHQKKIYSEKIWALPKKGCPEEKKRIWIKYKGKKYAWCNHVAIVVHTEKGRRVIDPASGPKAVTVAQWKKNIHLQDDVFKVRFLPGYRYCNPLERQKYFETKATPFANCPFRDDAFEKTKSELILQREEAKLETPQLAKACQ